MTDQQQLFYRDLKRIKYLDQAIKENPGVQEYVLEKDKTVVTLCNIVIGYGMEEAQKEIDMSDEETYSQIRQLLYMKILDHLYGYDPVKEEPQVYYGRFFRETIAEYKEGQKCRGI